MRLHAQANVSAQFYIYGTPEIPLDLMALFYDPVEVHISLA